MLQDDLEQPQGMELDGEDGQELPSGIKGLWVTVILRAWQARRWDYFLSTATTFPLAADCAGISVSAVRKKAHRKKEASRCVKASMTI
jgi:hypothetical protein